MTKSQLHVHVSKIYIKIHMPYFVNDENMFGINYILICVVYKGYMNKCKVMIQTINVIKYVL